MEVEFGKVNKVKVTSDNGKMVSHKVLVSTYQFWETGTKGNFRILISKVWGQKDSILEKLTLVSTERIDQTVKGNISGQMEIIIKVTLLTI